MSFFAILTKVCLFPEAFVSVLKNTLLRAVFHFFLFAIFFSFVLTCVHAYRINGQIRTACEGVMEQTGDFLLSPEKGLQTAKGPDKVKRYLLNSHVSIDFYPGKTLDKKAFDNVQTPYGLVFMDKGIVFWAEDYANMGKGRFLIAPMLLSLEKASENKIRTNISAEQMVDFMRKELILSPGEKLASLPAGRFNAKSLSAQLTAMSSTLIFVVILFGAVFTGLWVIVLFSLAQYFWFNGVTQKLLTYKQILCVLIYASFAPAVCGGLFSLIPGFMPAVQTVFLLVYFVYSFIVMWKLRKILRAGTLDEA